jgi:signal transduction histidine kinase
MLAMDADLILRADVRGIGDSYLHSMQIVRAVRRDARANQLDYVLTGAMIVVAIVVLATRIDADTVDGGAHAAPTVAGWAATIGVCCTLIGRRRWPLRCFSIAVVLLCVLLLTDNSDSVAYLAMLIGLYSAAGSLPLRRASVAVVMVLALVAASHFVALHNDPTIGLIGAGAAFALGRLIRVRRSRQDHDDAVARRRATAAIEIADLDAAEDRQRMAQELHDVVAHSLSVIAVRAGIGAHLIGREPDEAARALDAIRATSSAATEELARLIVLLRDGDGADAEPPALADVEALCAQVADARMPVDLAVDGDLRTVPAGASLAAYRIVQEALTNVVRHAGPASATVRVRVSPRAVEIVVEDNGRGARMSPEPERVGVGHGLIGMTERAAMYGGELVAGPLPGGGFRVHATLRTSVGAGEVDAPASDSIDNSDPVVAKVPPIVWDIGLALVFVAFAVRELIVGRAANGAYAPTDGWAWVFEIGSCVGLVGRRSYPAVSLLVSTVLGVALTLGDHNTGLIIVVFMVGLYSVGSYATTTRFASALLGIVIAMSIVAWSHPPDMERGAGAIWTGMIAAAAAVSGFVVRRDREGRDARISEHQNAGIDEARRARLAATTERLRVAEKLDRVINRSIDSISVAANTGSQVVTADPAAALVLLETISTTSRDALAELRRVLKRMRVEGETAPHAPVSTSAHDPMPMRS